MAPPWRLFAPLRRRPPPLFGAWGRAIVLRQFSLLPTTSTLGLAAVPELAFALQVAGLGAAVGSAVALRAQHRWPDVDTWQITTAWASLGLLIGVFIAVGAALA